MIVCLFAHVSSLKVMESFPLKKLLDKVRNSCQTYINFHKTHAIATHYGVIGVTSKNNPDSQNMDADNQNNY